MHCNRVRRGAPNPSAGSESWRSASRTPLQSAIRQHGGIRLPQDSTATEWREVRRLRPSLFRRGRSRQIGVDELAESLGFDSADSMRAELQDEIHHGTSSRGRRDEDLSFQELAELERREHRERGVGVLHRPRVYEMDALNWTRLPSSRSLRRGVQINPEGLMLQKLRLPSGHSATITIPDRELARLLGSKAAKSNPKRRRRRTTKKKVTRKTKTKSRKNAARRKRR